MIKKTTEQEICEKCTVFRRPTLLVIPSKSEYIPAAVMKLRANINIFRNITRNNNVKYYHELTNFSFRVTMFSNQIKLVCSVCHVKVKNKDALENHMKKHKKALFKLKGK